RFGMTNTRLAIVDLAGGDQPLSDERGRYWVMQNGEIYNYVELIAELEQLGHRFATHSDTEVIAHAYEEGGVGCLERFNGDFPVATYLSGGLDSSAIAAIAARQLRDDTLFAFGVGFADQRYDESESQDAIARELGTIFHRTVVDAAAIADVFPRAVELAEKPLLRTAPAPLLRLSGAVREAGLRVVLTGEAADELFGGYDIFREDKVRRFWARDPSSKLRPLLFARLNRWLATDPAKAGAFLSRFYGRDLEAVDDPLYSHRLR